MLQKTLLNIEGLGRQLDPNLDLWTTAKPYLERWMSEQLGWRGFVRGLQNEAPRWANMLPQLPRLVHNALAADPAAGIERALERLAAEQRRRNRVTVMLGLVLAALLAWQIVLAL
jgi:ubiquinone biosynthesis protein